MAAADQPPTPLATHRRFVPRDVRVPTEPLLRLQGYRDLARVRPRVRQMAEKAAALAEGLLAPEAHYRRVPILDCGADALHLETGTVFHSTAFAKAFAGCPEAVAFVLTLGSRLDDAVVAHTAREDLVTALFLETAGWVAIEQATKQLVQHLKVSAEAVGLRLRRRLAPGYADWALTEQAQFFDLFAGIDLPVRLLPSCAMLPKMSRSGLYGLSPAAAARSDT